MLSRFPTNSAPPEPPVSPENGHVLQVLNFSPVTSVHIRQWTDKDPTLAKVRDSLVASRRPQDDILQPYRKCWDELSVEQGCLLRGTRVVVPQKGREAVMKVLHEGHQGGTRMKTLARSFVWWQGIDKDLENVVSNCDSCQRTRHCPPKAPLHQWEFPSAPWERLHADFAGPFMNKMFLVVVDAHSKWLEVFPMSTTTAQVTIEKLRRILATHGLPRILTTDNGPQLISAEFQAFMKANGIRHIRSSPHHPATNGLAERAVQSSKEHVKRFRDGSLAEKLAKFLAWYQTYTPLDNPDRNSTC